jgi:hypothetical protein
VLNPANGQYLIAREAQDVSMKHLLERRESQRINNEERKFTRFDSRKAFAVHFKERGAGDHEGK